MFYENSYWGMHFFWWFIWILFLVWIFVLPYGIPGQRSRRESPMDILRRRLAAGEIRLDEYNEKKKVLESDTSGLN